MVLPSDDATAYQQRVAAYEAEYKPVGLRERELVQSLATISHKACVDMSADTAGTSGCATLFDNKLPHADVAQTVSHGGAAYVRPSDLTLG